MSDRLARCRLYLCTGERPDLVEFVAACVRGGVDVVQLREKHLDDRALLDRAQRLQALCAGAGVPFIVNDRPDLAARAGADGVHLGQTDPAPSLARELLGPDAVIGRSTHAVADLERALTEPVDYLSAGPVVPTPTKPGRAGTGTGYLSTAVERSALPVFVTGAVAPHNVGPLVAAGARHFVAVRWLTESSDPEGAARALRTAIEECLRAARPGGGAGERSEGARGGHGAGGEEGAAR
ncbi:MAG TPA: thiamine phosphate synthase [Acidimicrobiales bacterium]